MIASVVYSQDPDEPSAVGKKDERGRLKGEARTDGSEARTEWLRTEAIFNSLKKSQRRRRCCSTHARDEQGVDESAVDVGVEGFITGKNQLIFDPQFY